MIVTILMAFALVLLILAAFNVGQHPRVTLGWLGMAFWAAAYLISAVNAPVP